MRGGVRAVWYLRLSILRNKFAGFRQASETVVDQRQTGAHRALRLIAQAPSSWSEPVRKIFSRRRGSAAKYASPSARTISPFYRAATPRSRYMLRLVLRGLRVNCWKARSTR